MLACRKLIRRQEEIPAELLGEGVVGVDEVGRGALAGPVVAAAVVLPQHCSIEGLQDSKCCSPALRKRLGSVIESVSLGWGIGVASARLVDEVNVLQASLIAMRQAVSCLPYQIWDLVVVDGIYPPLVNSVCVVGGDSRIPSISASSILAKVWRDRWMESLHTRYPQYGFSSNKGYPTVSHRRALRATSPLPCIHRFSFYPIRQCQIS